MTKKSKLEMEVDRLKFGLLQSVSSESEAVSLVISPLAPNHSVVPIAIFAQSRVNILFPSIISLGECWNTAPTRKIKIARCDMEDNEVASSDYCLPQLSPRDSALQLAPIEVAALDTTTLKGTKLKVSMDGHTTNEW